MNPSRISKRIVADRLKWIESMLANINALPLKTYKDFISDKRNIWSAESCLRRCLEALMDLGRHILAKGFAQGVTEYKEISSGLLKAGLLSEVDAVKLRILAGYRNRMVHFYHEISHRELYEICCTEISDINYLVDVLKKWIKNHPDLIDETL